MSSYIIILIMIISMGTYAVSSRVFFLSLPVAYAFAAQTVSDSQELSGISLNLSMLYGSQVLAFATLECAKAVMRKGRRFFDAVSIATILFFFYLCLTTVLSVDPFKSFISMVKMATWMMVFLASREIFSSERDLRAVSISAGLCCLVIIISYAASRLGFFGSAHLGYYKQWGIMIYTGGFYGPTGLSLPLVMTIPAMLTVSWGRWNWLKRTLITLGIVVILFSYLRSALVMFVAGWLVFTYYAIRYRGFRVGTTFILPAIAFVVISASVALVDSGHVFARWTSMAEQLEKKDYSSMGSGRVGLLENVIDFYLNRQSAERMIIGNGLGTSWIAAKSRKVAHNDFAEVLIGGGILGLLLYVVFLFAIGMRLRRIVITGRFPAYAAAGCLAIFSFVAFLAGHFRGISQAVFPLTIMAVHIGAVMATQAPIRTNNAESEQLPEDIAREVRV